MTAASRQSAIARVHELAVLLAAPIEGRKGNINARPPTTKRELPLPANWSAADAAWCAHNNAGSQFLEDVALLPTLLLLASALAPRARPRFVELGAFDGITLSNTVMLERCFGWTGLLIEGNPTKYAELSRAKRTAP